jgi:hypothetical protein
MHKHFTSLLHIGLMGRLTFLDSVIFIKHTPWLYVCYHNCSDSISETLPLWCSPLSSCSFSLGFLLHSPPIMRTGLKSWDNRFNIVFFGSLTKNSWYCDTTILSNFWERAPRSVIGFYSLHESNEDWGPKVGTWHHLTSKFWYLKKSRRSSWTSSPRFGSSFITIQTGSMKKEKKEEIFEREKNRNEWMVNHTINLSTFSCFY